MNQEPTFAQLFKFLRIQAKFKTISHFANTLAEEGYAYDNSLFSHWQRGNRVPRNRKLLLTLIKIFVQKKSITHESQANLLLESANKKSLTTIEKNMIFNGANAFFDKKLKNEQSLSTWKIKLDEFIKINKTNFKLKNNDQVSKKRVYRFNFILTQDTYKYFEQISKEKSISKATFLRKLIREHRQLKTIER